MSTEERTGRIDREVRDGTDPPANGPEAGDRVLDPVCRMRVLRTTPFRTERDGAVYYFCSEACLRTFRARPAAYGSSGH